MEKEKTIRSFIFLVLFVTALLNTSCSAKSNSNGAMFRGNLERTGIYSGSGPIQEPSLLWEVEIQEGNDVHEIAGIYENVLFVIDDNRDLIPIDLKTQQEQWRFPLDYYDALLVSNDVAYIFQDEVIFAIDVNSGLEIWKYEGKEDIYPCPAVSNGLVYFSDSEYFYALDSKTGEKKWEMKVTYGEACPAVSNGLVYFSDEEFFFALNAKTGKEKWVFKAENQIYTAPIISNDVVHFADDEYFYALDPITGEEKWKFEADRESFKNVTVAVSNGVVYTYDDRRCYAFQSTTGRELWYTSDLRVRLQNIAITENLIYFQYYNSIIIVINAKTGELEEWTINGWDFEVANGILYTVEDGILKAYK